MRYSPQEVLIGKADQDILSKKTACIVGLGALGGVASELLCRSGVNLSLFDYDLISESNLQRQTLYTEEDISKLKAIQAKDRLQRINSNIDIFSEAVKIDQNNVDLLKGDIIVDCTDNIETRLVLNSYAKQKGIPLIHGAALGSVGVFFAAVPSGSCLSCLYEDKKAIERCESAGVYNSVTTIVGSLQANEALKHLLGKEFERRMVRFSLEDNSFSFFDVSKKKDCKICSGNSFSEGKLSFNGAEFHISICKVKGRIIVKPKRQVKLNLEKIRSKFPVIMDASVVLVIEKDYQIIVHSFGELLFKGCKDIKTAKSVAKEILEIGL